MSLEALALDPMTAADGSIRQVRPFGNDPFEFESACVLKHGWPVRIEMLAEANGRAGRQNSEKPLQQVFTALENHFCQIEPFAVENIEDDVAESIHAAGFQIDQQIIEARNAAPILDDNFPIDQRRFETERLGRVCFLFCRPALLVSNSIRKSLP